MSCFTSTRNSNERADTRTAVLNGLCPDGGLYVPEKIPYIEDVGELMSFGYQKLAEHIISLYFDDIDIGSCVKNAYSTGFDTEEICPLKKAGDLYFLELWHGPTSAFKDLALQFLPQIMTACHEDDRDIVILSATSGDTGKAALEGFKDVKGSKITVIYPYRHVSAIQERQMCTTEGNNTRVLAMKGDFDDCQKMVKDILEHHHSDRIHLTSANSINIARLIPQIVYYFKAYLDLLKNNVIVKGEKVDFIVPTGNFGDILAGWLAKRMGLPINRLVCASNMNNVLTDFFKSGVYDADRELHSTMEPSIDILVSSNLERLLYLAGRDSDRVKELMKELGEKRSYRIDETLHKTIREDFLAFWAGEEDIAETIREYYDRYSYLMDTHTATAASVAARYDSGCRKIVLSTASPFKFSKDVYRCLCGKETADDLEAMDILSGYTHVPIPENLSSLKDKKIRFDEVMEKDDRDHLIRILEGEHV